MSLLLSVIVNDCTADTGNVAMAALCAVWWGEECDGGVDSLRDVCFESFSLLTEPSIECSLFRTQNLCLNH